MWALQSKIISYKGHKLHYVTTGQGPAVVLVHGFCEDHRVWWPWAEPLAEHHKLILPDLPGFGGSELMHAEMQMKDYADAVHAVVGAENVVTAPFLGHSMGGYTILQLAKHHPECIGGIGLFHSTAAEDDDQKKEDRLRVAAFVRQHGKTPFVAELIPKLFAANYIETNKEKIDAWMQHCISASSEEGIIAASLAMRSRGATTDVLQYAPFPVLFLIGKQDKAVLPDRVLPQTHLPQRSVVELLEDAAHMGMMEAPERCLEAVRQWLNLCIPQS
ncbi:MAG: alpha/beta hydrolase [Chitinophagales bacterium]|nr:alpha/beta hydrolase [Chitinophagales bacterium]MDW8428092.1 alpha/beta hydrolase [Chitinophagales bacterium]